MFVYMLGKAGVKVSFKDDKIVITKNKMFVGKKYCFGEPFKLKVFNVIVNEKASSFSYIVDFIDLWHKRLDHMNFSYIKKIRELGLLANLTLSNDKCEICVEAKSTKKICKQIQHREIEPLNLIHRDLGDLKHTMTRRGKMYYNAFIDDFSRYRKIYLLRNKNEAGETFLIYKSKVENQFNKKIKRLKINKGGEYDSNMLNAYCKNHSVIHEVTLPYSS